MGRLGEFALASFLTFGFAFAADVFGQEIIDDGPDLNLPSPVAPQFDSVQPPVEEGWVDPRTLGQVESPSPEDAPVPGDTPVPMPRTARFFRPDPWSWFPRDGWENSAELGLNGASGNTESLTLQTGARFKRKTDLNLFDLRLLQNRTHSAGVTSQNNVLLYGDFERSLGTSSWNWFVKQGLEYDELRTFDVRYFINSGLGYNWIDADGLLLSTRMGAGASREFGGIDDRWTPEALVGAAYEHQINERNKLVAKVDYYPALDDFSNFRTITDLSWEHLVDESPNLSLKLGALHRHDSQPDESVPNDLNYSALLLYKF